MVVHDKISFEDDIRRVLDAPEKHLNIKQEQKQYGQTLELTFKNPTLSGYRVVMIADTIGKSTGIRISTMAVRFPRPILPEMNTHRVFSRNSASSRARSIDTTIASVMNEPYIPLWTSNQKGMQGKELETNEEWHTCNDLWLLARDSAVENALRLMLPVRDYDNIFQPGVDVEEVWANALKAYSSNREEHPGVHKQHVNRIIEPYMWHEALITSTYWQNFEELRVSPKAQPEMQAAAVLMVAALRLSCPVQGGVHSPFVDSRDASSLNEALLRSASACARISYKNSDDITDNMRIAKTLYREKHMSPFEHFAIERDTFPGIDFDTSNLNPAWIQGRRILDYAEIRPEFRAEIGGENE